MIHHVLYRVSTKSGLYYIGRHSTKNIHDTYTGSGTWPKALRKRKKIMCKEVLCEVETEEHLRELEELVLVHVITDEKCMNVHVSSDGFACGEGNPAKSESERRRRSEQSWAKTETGRKWFSENNPSKKDSVKVKRSIRAKELWNTEEYREKIAGDNHFSKQDKYRQMMSIHNPMHDPDVRSKTIEKVLFITQTKLNDGSHAFLQMETKAKAKAAQRAMRESGWHYELSEAGKAKLRQPKIKVVCPHCGKEGGKPVMARYHGDNCKFRSVS